MRLTGKQEAFALAYCANGGNATEAYVSVYDVSGKVTKTVNENACRLVKNSKVAARINEIQSKAKAIAEESLGITFEWKQRILKQVVERSLQLEPVTDQEGNPIGDHKFNASAVISAINELNKMDGDHSANKVDVTGRVTLTDFLDSLPD